MLAYQGVVVSWHSSGLDSKGKNRKHVFKDALEILEEG